jgi:hypothetical protein
MTELEYMRQSLAELYDELEKLLQKYEPSHASDDLFRALSGVVHVVDGPNDSASNGGKAYHCKGGKWHGQWQSDAS